MKRNSCFNANACLAALTLLLFPVALLSSPWVVAQAGSGEGDTAVAAHASDEAPEAVVELSESVAQNLDKRLVDLERRRSQIARLEERIAGSDKRSKPIFQLRLAQSWVQLLQDSVAFAGRVSDLREQGTAGSDYWDQAIAELNVHLDIARFASNELASHFQIPPEALSPVEQTAAYARFFQLIKLQDVLLQGLFDSVALSRHYELDVTAEERFLRVSLDDRASNNSVLLDLAMLDARGLRAGLASLPDNVDLKEQLALGEGLVTGLAASLQTAVSMMAKLDMETAEYREQIIRGTGALSSEAFTFEVFVSLLQQSGQAMVDSLIKGGPDFLLKVLIFFLVILVSRKLAKVVQKLVEAGLRRSQVDLSQLLRNTVVWAARQTVLVLGMLIALSQIGISLGPVLAGLGVAGFVIGFAMQDTLSNFASGMMILVYRPFDMGDVVEAGGVSGKVKNMSLVSTTILTFDNQTMVVPNNKIWGDVIKNVTSQRTRRVDLVFGISYDDDITKAEQVLKDIVEADARVLKKPEPTIKLHELGDSSMNFIVRPWVKTADYWDVYWDLTRAVKLRFDREQISIPYPQRDVHFDTDQLLNAVRQQGEQET
jgi:small conductance mechanosensitive channel